MNHSLRRFLSIALCAVLGAGIPAAGSFAAKSDAPCTMSAGSDDCGSYSSDCNGDPRAMSGCAQVCGFVSGCMALASNAQRVAPDVAPVLIPKARDSYFASRAGPPLLQPPR